MRGNFNNQRNGRGFSGNWQNRGHDPRPDARHVMVQLRFALDQLYTNITSTQQCPVPMVNMHDIVTPYFSVAGWFNQHAQKFAMAPVTLCLDLQQAFGDRNRPPPGCPVGGGPTNDSAPQAGQYHGTPHAAHGPANVFAPRLPPPVNEFQWQLQQSGPVGLPNGQSLAPGYIPTTYSQAHPNSRLPSDQTNPYSDYGGAIPANARIAPAAAYPGNGGRPQMYNQPQGQQGINGGGNGVYSSDPQPQVPINPGPAQVQHETYHPQAHYDDNMAGEHAVHLHKQQAPTTSAVRHDQGAPWIAPSFQHKYIDSAANTRRNNHAEARAPNNFAVQDGITSNGPKNTQSVGDSSLNEEGCVIGPQKQSPMSFPTPKGQAQRHAPVTFGDIDQDDDDVPHNNGEGQYINNTGNTARTNNNAQTAPQLQGQAAMQSIPQSQAMPCHQQSPCDHVMVPASKVTRDHPMYPHIRRKWRKERGRSPIFYYEVPRNINSDMAHWPQPQGHDQGAGYAANFNPEAIPYDPSNPYRTIGGGNGPPDDHLTDAMPINTMPDDHMPSSASLPDDAAAESTQDSNGTANGTAKAAAQSALNPTSHLVGGLEPSDLKTRPVLDTMPGTIIAGLDIAEITFALPYPYGPGPLVVDGTNWPRKLIPTVHPVKTPDNRHHPAPKTKTDSQPQPVTAVSKQPVVNDNTPDQPAPATVTRPATPNDSPAAHTTSATDSSHTLAAESPAIDTSLAPGSSQPPVVLSASSGVTPVIPFIPASPVVQTGPATDDALHPLSYEYAVVQPAVIPTIPEETGPAPADSNSRPVNGQGPVNDPRPANDPNFTTATATATTTAQQQQPPTKPKRPRPNNNNRRRNKRRREAENPAAASTGSPKPKAKSLGARSQQNENVEPSSGAGHQTTAKTRIGDWYCDVCRTKVASLEELEGHMKENVECGAKSEWA
ncbi:hypothetical protein GE09DRAFT_1264480 [Coniochaeta sp. 2T2.1]|nr:hypothetical protein GE09DRAFT_1264480 [Coniochaeta sp. 2T2.1]